MTRSDPGVPNPPPISRRFGEAMEFARSKHNGQTRKGTDIPYLGHLLAVAALAIEDAASDSALFERTEEVAIAAVLHDIVEDTFDRGEERVTVEELRGRFGDEVARIVEGCSDTSEPGPDGQKEAWGIRKERYLAHLAVADAATLCVSLADKRHNARCIVDDLYAADDPATVWSRFNAEPEQQAWYYDSVAIAFERHRPGRRADELRRTVEELRRYVVDA